MNRHPFHSERGAVILVALCFVAVLGISLAAYLALCSRTMQMSNRTAQTALSQQLAEMGVEEALRAFNKNNWSDWTNGTNPNITTANWTLSGTTATCTITFPTTKFGQGVTGSVKIRVDNYNSAQLLSAWSSTANYRIGNVVSYTDGNWYRCISANLNKAPSTTNSNSTYWIQEHGSISSALTWTLGTVYASGNMVIRNNGWYRCISPNTASATNQPPDGANWATYWTSAPYVSADADLQSVNGTILRYYVASYGNDYWYRYNNGWDQITSGSWTLTWRWTASTPYAVGAIISYNNIWYRCRVAHNSGTGGFSTTNWDTASTLATSAATGWNWSSTATYNLNDVAYYSSRWYRSVAAGNINNTPSTSSAYWSVSPSLSRYWESTRQYSANDTVYYNGIWYLAIASTNYGQNPATATTYWRSAANASYRWSASTSYAAGAYCSYGGVWYRAASANTGRSPNNNTYWSAAWTQSSGVTTGTTVIYSEGTINIAGSGSTKTQLRATLAPAPLFPNAVAASTNLSITSATGVVDSYDSGLGVTTYYSQVGNTATNYSAVIAAGSTLTIGGTTAVSGYLAWPSPPSGISSGTTVKGPTSPSSPNIDTSRISRSPFIPQFDIEDTAAGTTLNLANSTGYTLGTAGATTPTVYNISSTANSPHVVLNNASEILTIVGPVILNIDGNLQITTGKIVVAATGSAEIHFSGRLRIQDSTGGIQNLSSDPKKLTLLGTSTATNHTFESQTNDFFGTIYMPYGTLTIDSGVRIWGALSAKNITFSSEATLHYDTSLRYATTPGVDQPYAITEWRELTDSAERVTMP